MTATELAEEAARIADATPAPTSGLARLRQPFPASQVGSLPQPYKKDSPKGTCSECGKWHGLPAMHLDYVGHGAVTDRLLEVDPSWTWEPFAVDAAGLPALDKYGNLWIRLTVLGVTRIGVGDGASMKVLIGDALRNAAMRFGVALDLWIRGDGLDEKAEGDERIAAPPPDPRQIARAEVGARIKALDATARAAIKEFCTEDGIPPVPLDWTDRQLHAVIEQVAIWEQVVAAPETPLDGPESAPDPDPAPEVPDPSPACEEPGCTNPRDGLLYCSNHEPF